MATITGVTFKDGGKIYYFAPEKNAEYKTGMGVIVETSRGVEYATVVTPIAEVDDDKLVSPLKPIIRKATQKDEETNRRNLEKRAGAMQTVREMIEKHGLEMKLIDCEFTFDGSKAAFYYSAPQRVDFRELLKDLSSHFHMRIELRQVGIRDEIKMIGGIAPCGRECCCSSYMPDIKKVSIKMAKNQGLSLNPQKISGLCGRLMCCLSYENDYYADACKKLPKVGAEVGTPEGKGVVVNVNMLKMEVRVKIEDKAKDIMVYKDFPAEELRFRRQKGEDDRDDDDSVLDVVLEKSEEIKDEERSQPRAQEKRSEPRRQDHRDGSGEKRHDTRPQDRREGNGEKRNNKNRRRKKNSGNPDPQKQA